MATIVAASLLALSYGVLALRAADRIPMSGLWNALMIPAYLTLLGGALLSIFGVPTALFVPISAVALLVPFAVIDAYRRRISRNRRAA